MKISWACNPIILTIALGRTNLLAFITLKIAEF
jgi:hypothetical protein